MNNKNITLGFSWHESMSYETFLLKNRNLKKDNRSWEIFNLIEERYIESKNEDK